MANLPTPLQPSEDLERLEQIRIRNRLISVVGLLLVIALLFVFLLLYSGGHSWRSGDASTTVFVAVSVNIVLLTTVFYLILRNLFKLVYERKRSIGGVGLKTKLIIAFVALSLPSTAFHLMASGFLAFLFESWSSGEQHQLLNSAKVVVDSLTQSQEESLRQALAGLVEQLPRDVRAYERTNWMGTNNPLSQGAVIVYRSGGQVLAQWSSDPQILAKWKPLPAADLLKHPPVVVRSQAGKQLVLSAGENLPAAGLRVEVLQLVPPPVAQAAAALAEQRASSLFLGRDLLLLVLSILVVMTLFIIFAATWMAFYLAKGFVTPIEVLADATQRVSRGDLGYEVSTSSLGPLEPDFHALVESFNLMSHQLNEQRRQLVRTSEDLRRSGQTLEERNRLVELLLEKIDAGIVSINPQGRISAMNHAALLLLLPQQEQWLGQPYDLVLAPESATLVGQMLDRVRLNAGKPANQLFSLTLRGRSVHVEASALALQNESGASEGMVLMLKDVTVLQRNQRALAWREVARRVAHEIKNPLTPIQVSADRLRRKYLHRLDGEGQVLDQCTQDIINAVSSLKQMVNEFSQFAKLPESHPVPDDLNEVIRDIARFYKTGLPEGIRLELDLDPQVPRFPLDREQLKRAFINLIDNAAASIKGQGHIHINSSYDPIVQQVNVDVVDDGSGVPPQIRGRLFEPYSSTKEGGTGLGLTIVNQIVSDHNGDIRFAENKPHGSVFSMEFRLR